jgi:hypothetical protein
VSDVLVSAPTEQIASPTVGREFCFTLFVDSNGDGVFQPNREKPLAGIAVVILDEAGNEVTRAVSDAYGRVCLFLPPGRYRIGLDRASKSSEYPDAQLILTSARISDGTGPVYQPIDLALAGANTFRVLFSAMSLLLAGMVLTRSSSQQRTSPRHLGNKR